MVKNSKIVNRQLLVIVFLCLLFFLPFLLKPELLTLKDNDLGRTYIPIFNFIHNSFYENKSLPFWRPEQMMGEPLIGNALFPIPYPLNIILLILPINYVTFFNCRNLYILFG